MNDWQPTRLGDHIQLHGGLSYEADKFDPDGIPLVTMGCVSPNERMQMSGLKYYGGTYRDNHRLRESDIVIATRDVTQNRITLGAPAIVTACLAKKRPIAATNLYIVTNIGGIEQEFLFYLLKSPAYRQRIIACAKGTTVLMLTKDAVLNYDFRRPPIDEQRAIAHILGTLDDKIELNRRKNETLEAMARALFHDWFVAFGPTRAKMAGQEPYLPKHLWDLFPDALDSEGIPNGWHRSPVSDLIEFNPTERLSKNTVAPYLDMASLPTQGSWPSAPVQRAFGSGMRFRNGDTLMARITPCLENGKTAFIQCLDADQVAWGSTEYIVMRSKEPVPPEFSYLLARDKDFRQHTIRSMTGTSGRQRAQADSVAAYSVASPHELSIWQSFGKMVGPMFAGTKVRSEESETLSTLRDTLLPKLISGELRVPDVDRILERAL